MLGSVRFRLVLLIALVFVPILVFALLQARSQRAAGLEEVRAQSSTLAGSASQGQREAIRETRTVLLTLSRLFSVVPTPLKDVNRESCDRFLATLKQEAAFADYLVADIDGTLVCASTPAPDPINLADRAYFQEAVATRSYAVGEVVIGRISGTPVINSAYPIFGPSESIRGVVVASLDVHALALEHMIQLPEGGVVTAFDNAGTRYARYPEPTPGSGQAVPYLLLAKTALEPDMPHTFEAAGVDGERRIYGVARVLPELGERSLIIAAGVPTSLAFASADQDLKRTLLVLGLVSLLAISAAWFLGDRLVVRHLRKLALATDRLASGELEAQSGVDYSAGEFGRLARGFDQMAAALQGRDGEIRALNRDLEEKVRRRTAELEVINAQLQAVNKELEGFSYSVSHDLRAPIRAIAGYSQMLVEDQGDRLDDEGRRYLAVIEEQTNKMGQLIDDLLAFSRLGRKDIAPSIIDMSNLVKGVIEELKSAAGSRHIEFSVSTLLSVRGDPAMFRQVWMNLLSNAIKFTRPRQQARITVTSREDGQEVIYSIGDNGVGFDMRYVDKLFGVFQRLHGMDEFEGTGVGLAIVQRVVQRHGGRAWAEGKVGEGAVFSFALPKGPGGV